MYTTKKEFMANAKKQLQVFNELISDLRIVKRVANEMDGKVYNKKFLTNCQKLLVNSYISYSHSYNEKTFVFLLQAKKRYYPAQPDKIGYCGTCYVDYSEEDFGIFTNNEKRIIASETIESINNTIKRIENKITEWQFVVDNYDAIVIRTKELQKEIDKFHKEIPNFARPYFFANSGITLVM